MGLDGFVSCRCWQDGVVTPPECLTGLIVLDQDEGYLDLSVPYEGNERLHSALLAWRESSPCPHEDMEQASEHVGNWTGYRGFRHALGSAGWKNFPVLRAELPSSNGGTTPASSAAAALAELRHYEDHATDRPEAVLCDAGSGEVVWTQIHSFGGARLITARGEFGVDLDGFFARSGDTEFFRATRFDQADVPGHPFGSSSRVLEVRARHEPADTYDFVVTALRTLFTASLQTGNPVAWC